MYPTAVQLPTVESETLSSPNLKQGDEKSVIFTVNLVRPTSFLLSPFNTSESEIKKIKENNMNILPPLLPRKKKPEPMVFKPFVSLIDLEMTVKSLNNYIAPKANNSSKK